MEIGIQEQKIRLINGEANTRLLRLGLDQETIDHIDKTTSSFDYMYTATLERIKAASINPGYLLKNGNVVMPFWTDTNMRPGGGACFDASENLRFTWFFDGTFDKLHEKGLSLFPCNGSDGKYFVGEGFSHVFLVIAKLNRDGKSFQNQNAVVVDPSLQNILALDKSSYSTSNVYMEDTIFINDLNKEIVPFDIENIQKPTYIITNKSTAVLGMDPDRKNVLYMVILYDKKKRVYYPAVTMSGQDGFRLYYKPEDSVGLWSAGNLRETTENAATVKLVKEMATEASKIRIVPARYDNGAAVDATGAKLTEMPFTRKMSN